MLQALARRIARHEELNFLLTNRLPRRYATLLMGWLSRVENPLVYRPALAAWRLFAGDFRLHEAKRTRFKSLHDCFIRELADDARPIARGAGLVVSPCDGIVGASGRVDGVMALQIKGFRYEVADLIPDPRLVERFRGGVFVTLRLTSNMYHRFHAPADGVVRNVSYVSGDTWNVNPIALRRIERLFCKNERAVAEIDLGRPERTLALVAVAAILVASIRIKFLPEPLSLRYRGPNRFACDKPVARGEEIGWFEHGSTIIVFGTSAFALHPSVAEGATIRMGEPLLDEL